ncbi:MAG: hypothetical protein ABI547_05635, partial [Betaproteobacteria bacterium]
MKILISAVLALLVVTAQPAAAQWRNHGGGARHFEVQQGQRGGGYQQRQSPQRDFQQHQQPQRDFRQPDYRRDYRQPDRQPDRRPDGRMTDEERHNLRRDLDRANRE